MNEQEVTLVGGPLNGEHVPAFQHRTHIPMTQHSQSKFGDSVDDVAVYEMDVTGLRAHYIQKGAGDE